MSQLSPAHPHVHNHHYHLHLYLSIISLLLNCPLAYNENASQEASLSTMSTSNGSEEDVRLVSSTPLAYPDDYGPEEFLLPSMLRITATCVCVIVMLLGVTGNILVPFVVCRTRELCTNSTNVFLINLSIADLLVLIVCMPTVLIELHSRPEVWNLGEGMCKVVPFVELVVAHGSILTILAISFERYYAICKPLKASYKCTMRWALIIIFSLWSLAILATVPVLFGTELVEAVYIDGSIVNVCITKANTTWQKVYFLVSMTAFFWIPLLILMIIYLIIVRRLIREDRRLVQSSIHTSSTISGSVLPSCSSRRSSLACVSHASTKESIWPSTLLWRRCGRQLSSESQVCHGGQINCANITDSIRRDSVPSARLNVTAERAQMRSRRQVVFMLVTVVICFFACLLPFRVLTLWLLFATEDEIRALSMEKFYNCLYFCRIMIYVNSMLNPFLYAVVSSKFRAAFVEAVYQYCCYCGDVCCCCGGDGSCGFTGQDDLDFAKGLGPRGKARRRYRRNRRFLLRQSTNTTNTSSSLKNNSLHSANLEYQGRYSSLDSILAARTRVQTCLKQNSSDSESNRTARLAKQDSCSSNDSDPNNSTSYVNVAKVYEISPLAVNSISQADVIVSRQPDVPAPFDCNNLCKFPAEYRRAIMLKRTSRVAIVDDDDEGEDQREEVPREFSRTISHDSEENDVDEKSANQNMVNGETEAEVIEPSLPDLEVILSDPEFATFESFV